LIECIKQLGVVKRNNISKTQMLLGGMINMDKRRLRNGEELTLQSPTNRSPGIILIITFQTKQERNSKGIQEEIKGMSSKKDKS